jgi:hypothetical protein
MTYVPQSSAAAQAARISSTVNCIESRGSYSERTPPLTVSLIWQRVSGAINYIGHNLFVHKIDLRMCAIFEEKRPHWRDFVDYRSLTCDAPCRSCSLTAVRTSDTPSTVNPNGTGSFFEPALPPNRLPRHTQPIRTLRHPPHSRREWKKLWIGQLQSKGYHYRLVRYLLGSMIFRLSAWPPV